VTARQHESQRPHAVCVWLNRDELSRLDALVRAARSNRSAVIRGLLGEAEASDDEPRHYLPPEHEAAMRRVWERGLDSTYSLAATFGCSQTSVAVRTKQWRRAG
jgi:hypothetical protein